MSWYLGEGGRGGEDWARAATELRAKRLCVPLERELVQVDFALRGRDQIERLPHFGVERSLGGIAISSRDRESQTVCAANLVEKLQQIHVARLRAEMLLQQPVHRALEHARVVDGDEPDAVRAVPARPAATRGARVHEVVRDKEERLELAHTRRS